LLTARIRIRGSGQCARGLGASIVTFAFGLLTNCVGIRCPGQRVERFRASLGRALRRPRPKLPLRKAIANKFRSKLFQFCFPAFLRFGNAGRTLGCSHASHGGRIDRQL
jgi:hypothetical protein